MGLPLPGRMFAEAEIGARNGEYFSDGRRALKRLTRSGALTEAEVNGGLEGRQKPARKAWLSNDMLGRWQCAAFLAVSETLHARR